MKRRKLIVGAACAMTVGLAVLARAAQTHVLEWNFFAPVVTDHTTIDTPKKGDIVFESSSTNEFLGYNGTNWVNFGGTATANLNVVTKTGTYTLDPTSDDMILADATSAPFTLNLPTAFGNLGKTYHIRKIDTGNANNVTIDGFSTETIDSATTYILYTQNEELTIVSDGTNWQILQHKTSTPLSSCSALTIGAVTSNPTKGTTTKDCYYWHREGQFAHLIFSYYQSAAGSGAAGSGNYLVTLPFNVDTSYATVNNGTITINTNTAIDGRLNGECFFGGTSGTGAGFALLYSSNQFRVYLARWDASASAPVWGSTFGALSGALVHLECDLRIPVSGWKD